MKSSIFQNLPDVCPVRIIMDKLMWCACMKNISETSAALSNGAQHGVGLGRNGINARKKHFFLFNNTPTTRAPFQTYNATMGMNNIINKTL